MNKNDCLYEDILKREIVIPDVVCEKANDAFSQLKTNAECRKDGIMEKRRFLNVNAKVAAIFLIFILCSGGITAFAAYMHWSESIKNNMNITNEQMEELEQSDNSLISYPQSSDTQGNISVSISQCIVAYKDIRLSLYIDGYDVNNKSLPSFETFEVNVEGVSIGDVCYEFFDSKGYAADGRLELYVTGRLQSGQFDVFNGKKINVQIRNIGNYTGEWNMGWTINGVEETKDYTFSERLGSTGATVEKVKLSPISAEVQYDYERKFIKEETDENGKDIICVDADCTECTELSEPPTLRGVKMKDGTIYETFGGGCSGYVDQKTEKFIFEMSFARIIDVDEVEALLFINHEKINDDDILTEEECFVVGLDK